MSEAGFIDRKTLSNAKVSLKKKNMLIMLISWEKTGIQEPVFTCSMTQNEIEYIKKVPLTLPPVKIHTQSTERAVKSVTEAAKAVAGCHARDGYIRARIHHREVLPVFKNKRDILKTFK